MDSGTSLKRDVTTGPAPPRAGCSTISSPAHPHVFQWQNSLFSSLFIYSFNYADISTKTNKSLFHYKVRGHDSSWKSSFYLHMIITYHMPSYLNVNF